MVDFKKWAKSDPGTFTTRPQREEPVVRPTPSHYPPQPSGVVPARPEHHQPAQPGRGSIVWAPTPQPAFVQLGAGGVGFGPPPQPISDHPDTCVVTKIDPEHGDPYQTMMRMTPDLAQEVGIDEAKGADAMRMAGRPDQAEMRDWRPTTRYYNGVSDQTATGRLEEHASRHTPGGIGHVRSGSASPQGINQPGSLSPIRWS